MKTSTKHPPRAVAVMTIATAMILVAPQAARAATGTFSVVSGQFFPNPSNSGAFTATTSTPVSFTQTFPIINFNAPGVAVACSNNTGVDVNTRPFTDVVPQADGSCTTLVAEGNGFQVGVGTLFTFDAVFQGSLTIGSGNVTFHFFSDDGWILGMGPGPGGAQPTYVSGPRVNDPGTSPFTGFQTVGAFNTGTAPTRKDLVVNFPSAGTYPFEIDFSECCGGQIALTVTAEGGIEPARPVVTSVAPACSSPTGGDAVTITGSGFTSDAAVSFGATLALSVKVDSENQITAVAPPGSGTVDVTVMTSAGTSATSSADLYTYSPTCPSTDCTGVVCTALDQCHDVGVCDPSTGVCSNPPKANGASCDDGNACTQTDTCQADVCVGSNPVVCKALDQCHDPGTCDRGSGRCSDPPKPDGASCDDGRACTVDACAGGVCIGRDITPPAVTCTVSTPVLWKPFPPNHTLLGVGLTSAATDLCDGPRPVGVAVFGDEDDETPTGDGVFSPDAKNIAPATLLLRDERVGEADGRVYLIVSRAADLSSNIGVACCTVAVPHSQSAADISSVMAQAAAAQAFCAANYGTPPPGYVVVGDGPEIGPKQ